MTKIPAHLETRFQDDVLAHLGEMYHDAGGQFQGQAVSFLKSCMHDKGWKNLGHLADFESLLQSAGFVLRRAQNRRGNWANVVTL